MIDELKDRLLDLNELRLSLINVLQLKGSSITNQAKLSDISEKIDELELNEEYQYTKSPIEYDYWWNMDNPGGCRFNYIGSGFTHSYVANPECTSLYIEDGVTLS